MRALVAKGWTPAAAAIAASDAQQESSIRPDGPMGDPSTPGGSWGMFQWNRERLAALKRFGKGLARLGPTSRAFSPNR
jgi:hypothetical protein